MGALWRHQASQGRQFHKLDPLGADEQAVVEAVLREAVQVFHPRYINIGYDELFCDTKTLIRGATRLRDFLAGMGVRTMMWGDLFLYKGEAPDAMNAPNAAEAKLRRESLPKDIVVCDWHYEKAPVEAYKSPPVVQRSRPGCDRVPVVSP